MPDAKLTIETANNLDWIIGFGLMGIGISIFIRALSGYHTFESTNTRMKRLLHKELKDDNTSVMR